MALTCTQMITEVKELIGRGSDSVLITDTRVARFLNEAQDFIARKCPGLRDLNVKDTTTFDTVQDQLEYDVSSLSAKVCHLLNVWYLDGTNSLKLDFKMHDEFDEQWPDPTAYDTGKPHSWTYRGTKIELFPVPSSDYAGKDLRLDYTKYPTTLSGSATSDLDRADDGLIMYAITKCWRHIGGRDAEYQKAKTEFIDWFVNEYKPYCDLVISWDGESFFDEI